MHLLPTSLELWITLDSQPTFSKELRLRYLHSTSRRISPRGSRPALGRAALAASWRTRCRHSSHPHRLACDCQSILFRRHFSLLQQQRLHWVWVWAFRLVPLKCAPCQIFLCTPVFALALQLWVCAQSGHSKKSAHSCRSQSAALLVAVRA